MNTRVFVHPADVTALKHRLHSAFVALCRDELAPGATLDATRTREAVDLVEAWNAYLERPADWLNAPEELELGFDLEARLALLQGDNARFAPGPHRAGETLGMHTVGELSDLRDALSYTVGQLTAAYNECADDSKTADMVSHNAWKTDFDAALQRFGRDWDSADVVIRMFPDWVPIGDAIPGVVPSAASSAWSAIVADIHAFTDLDRRMRALGICAAPTYPNMPQPTHSDVDLKAYNLSGEVLAGVKKGAQAVAGAATSPIPWLALGGLLAAILIIKLRN